MYRRLALIVSLSVLAINGSVSAQDQEIQANEITVPAAEAELATGIENAFQSDIGEGDYNKEGGRYFVSVKKTQRGTSQDVELRAVMKLCGDADGCSVRLGMYNWDDTGRMASRDFLLFYNTVNDAWRASNDSQGTNANNTTQHFVGAWACYFTDGKYENWVNKGDSDKKVALLSWKDNGYNADCFLTLID
jgi:hypothetical protein